ncbi:hypothetical protein [Amycolatopsis sp. NBC_00438]|uniref:hypothetical protein n=1 Tax=Amycolatopsis sp. NBC_00438 TaxID=2903558 RepID=UPI002E24959C
MTTHPALLTQLLDDEVEVARSRLGDRATGIERVSSTIRVPLSAPDGSPLLLVLDGSNFDAAPFGVTVTEPDGSPAPLERWPAGLGASMHPVLNRPFVCVRGCAEYYSHPSHLQESWDTVRNTLRLAELLDHLLRRGGKP